MIDWNNIERTVLGRYEERLRHTPQSPLFHAEGDALVHTQMVCEALMQLPEYQELNERQRHILYVAALLHDIGKAVDHEVEGTHAAIGAELLKRAGEDEDIVNAVAAHHEEVEKTSLMAILVQICDTLSASRPGARSKAIPTTQDMARLLEYPCWEPRTKTCWCSEGSENREVRAPPGFVQ